MNDRSFSTRRLALLGMLTALTFAGNYARIILPIAVGGNTAFTLGNITCCLSGLLLGPVGGLASGLGAALYDLTNPLYAAECWITFLNKGAMGLAAGLAVRAALDRHSGSDRDELTYPQAALGALVGCGAYYVLYFTKCLVYDGLLVGGLPLPAALAVLPLKVPASLFNASVAVLGAPPLALAIRAALKRSGLDRLMRA